MSDFRDELQQEIDKGQVTLIIGAGVSIAATGNPDVASWIGLLKRGVEECVRVAQPLGTGEGRTPSSWASTPMRTCRATSTLRPCSGRCGP